MFLTNFGVPGGLFLVARISDKKNTVNILFIGTGNTKKTKEKCHRDHWDVFENRFKTKLEIFSNPKNLLKPVRDSMLQMFRTDSVARNGKKTVFYIDVQLRHSTVGQNS